MGCCFSNDEDKEYQDTNQVNERSRLLSNPANPDGPSTRQIQSYNTREPTTISQKTGDEQSALNRILHQTANNVIDVSAIDSQMMEQHEYMERARQYSTRLALACSSTQRMRATPPLPAGVAAPQGILASQPPSMADIQMITNAAEMTSKTVMDIKVRHKEDLVVPFGVP